MADQSPPYPVTPEENRRSLPISVAPPSSVASTSIMVKERLDRLISEHVRPGSFKGKTIVMIDKEEWDQIKDTIDSIHESSDTPTVPVATLNDLMMQLNTVKMEKDRLVNASNKFAVQEGVLKKDIAAAKSALDKEQKTFAEFKAKAESTKAELVKQSSQLRKAQDSTNAGIASAKKAKDSSALEELSELKEVNAKMITKLNNELQELNSAVKAEKERKTKLEDKVTQLEVDLKYEKTKLRVESGMPPPLPGKSSFADAAMKAGSANVNLVNIAFSNLSKASRALLAEKEDADDKDVRNRLYWLTRALNASKHAVYKPYKLVLTGISNEVKFIAYNSRRQFLPLIEAVERSLRPEGAPLTEDEMTTILSKIDNKRLILNSDFQGKGYRTLQDLLDADKDFSDFDDVKSSNNLVGILKSEHGVKRDAEAKAWFIKDWFKQTNNGKKKTKEFSKEFPPLGGDKPKSSFHKVLEWFNSVKSRLRKSLVKKLEKSSFKMRKYHRLSQGNWFQRLLAIPYSWWLTLW